MQGGFGGEMRCKRIDVHHRFYIPMLTQYKVTFFVPYTEKPCQTIYRTGRGLSNS